jgi:hypothetical protein
MAAFLEIRGYDCQTALRRSDDHIAATFAAQRDLEQLERKWQ